MSDWELRKALRLLRKSNPPPFDKLRALPSIIWALSLSKRLLEWLKSPVVYRHDPVFAAEFGALAAEFYSARRCPSAGSGP